jgi:hypothetical protein
MVHWFLIKTVIVYKNELKITKLYHAINNYYLDKG